MSELSFALAVRSKTFDDIISNTIFTNQRGQQLDIEVAYLELINLLSKHRDSNAIVYLIGNGGSAAVVNHILTDFVNVCKFRATTLHDPALITCMSNDYGYEHAFEEALKTVFRKEDVLIAISSSGKSANICNAVKTAKNLGGTVITLSGFKSDNPLRTLGDYNFWLDSGDYGFVEIGHLFLLHNLADRIGYIMKEEKALAIA